MKKAWKDHEKSIDKTYGIPQLTIIIFTFTANNNTKINDYLTDHLSNSSYKRTELLINHGGEFYGK